jgi:serine/threonine protein phosphatase PrpC
MRFTIYQESRLGKRRANQDRVAYCYSRDALLMVVADGMGGHLHGEVAAQLAVQFITEQFQREAKPRLNDPFLFLSKSLTSAHFAIRDYAQERETADSPRTTCVACVVQDSIAYWAHAGDSRLYALRNGLVSAQTRDHSRVQKMIDRGLIQESEAQNHPARNRIFSCLGGPHPPQIDYSRKTPLVNGDVLCLCSDGAWGPLGNEAIAHAFVGGKVMDVVPRLMDDAERLGGDQCDNLTMLAMAWHDSYDTPAVEGSVSTKTLPLDRHTTVMEGFANRPQQEWDEADIERAIQEINSAIKKFSK